MGKSQRNKGAGYERELCEVFTGATGRKIQRHIGQARDGGNDITVGRLVVEAKRRKTLGIIEGWLAQAKAATVSAEQVAVVVARSDGGESLAILPLADLLRIIDRRVMDL